MKKLLQLILLGCMGSVAMAQTQILVPLPAQSTTFTGNVRGYWFTAPTCFTITGVQVPTDASTGNQSIAIVRLQSAPPLFSTTTNNFSTLFLTQNNPASGILPVNIQVETGDVIGVLGCRNTVNSYGTANYVSSIEGFPVTLARLGMQFPLTTTAPQDLWTEASGSISRVNLYYDSLITYNLTSTPITTSSFQFANGADTSFVSAWDFGDGSPLGSGSNPTHTYSTSGTYNVCTYITNACGTDTLCTTVTACGADPVASFTNVPSGATVAFSDATSNATSWAWDFGDSGSSTLQNPMHTYSASGTYNVCLIATNACAVSDTFCTTVTVCIPATASYTTTANGGTISFADATTNASALSWDFGDSSTGTGSNPSHTYSASGSYIVCLSAASNCDTAYYCDTVTVCIPAMANFGTSDLGNGVVQFSDSSSSVTNYSWDFGDSNSSTASNPSHTYATSGTYNVCLIAYSGCSSDTMCTSITVCLPVSAAYSDTTVSAGTIQFSGNTPEATSWSWDFGDSSTDNTQNPSHTYATSGTYTVCLIASNACSADTFCSTVTVCYAVSATYTSTSLSGGNVQFTDGSANASSWSWDFGDSSTSTSASPSHTYATAGTYMVCLVASNACSADSFCTTITVCPVALTSSFTSTSSNLNVSFTNTSAGASGSMWDFGDASTSGATSPQHTYASAGTYTVCLTTWNNCGDSTTTCNTITVQVSGVNDPVALAAVQLYPNPFTETAQLSVHSTAYTGAFVFEVYDVRGALVNTQSGIINQDMTIQRDKLSPGVYLYKVKQGAILLNSGKLVIGQ